MANVGEAFKEAGTILRSNEAINKVGDFLAGGFIDVARGVKAGNTVGKAIEEAFTTEGTNAAGQTVRNLNYGRVAGAYLGASTGYRMLSGGGLYKDKNGNTNLVGLPFV
jgi:hypothetical protein